MAKKGSKKKTSGALMGMRSGFKKAAGNGKKRKGKEEVSFQTVFTVLAVISLAIVLLWKFSQ
jgi:hypothetical protein